MVVTGANSGLGLVTSRELAGGGPLADIGVHVLDYALYLLGEPKVTAVSASVYAELGPRGLGGSGRPAADRARSAFEVEDFASAFLRLEGGGARRCSAWKAPAAGLLRAGLSLKCKPDPRRSSISRGHCCCVMASSSGA